MSQTPIRTLTLMLDSARQRQEAVEQAEARHEITREQWAPASRVWSRQQDALSCAIIAEPPQTLDDILAVMIELAGRHDLISNQGDEATRRERRELAEMTAVAVANCAARLGALIQPKNEPTEAQKLAIEWLSKQASQWLPSVEG